MSLIGSMSGGSDRPCGSCGRSYPEVSPVHNSVHLFGIVWADYGARVGSSFDDNTVLVVCDQCLHAALLVAFTPAMRAQRERVTT